MNRLIKIKLEALKQFQFAHPTSHVGGSIGLMLRGIDLQRDLSKSDLDITIDEIFLPFPEDEWFTERSDTSDFDLSLRKDVGNGYTKIDIRINPEPSFDRIEFEGIHYNVSKLRDILFWKQKYADKGVTKHIDDIETIKTGVRPEIIQTITCDSELPF